MTHDNFFERFDSALSDGLPGPKALSNLHRGEPVCQKRCKLQSRHIGLVQAVDRSHNVSETLYLMKIVVQCSLPKGRPRLVI